MTTSDSLARPRNGITLLEVLISIGILAIGLSSIVAVMPAAHSQASRAVMADRAAALASNALADVATFGLLRDGTSVLTVAPTATTPVLIDPAAANPYLQLSPSGTLPLARVRAGGAAAPAIAPVAPAGVLRLMTDLRDDVTFREASAPDEPPLNDFVDGARSYRGRMTSLLAIKPGVSAGTPGTMSAVVFQGRDAARPLAVTATLTNLALSEASLNTSDMDGRRMRDVVKPGVVLWDPAGLRFHQAVATAYDAAGTTAYLTLQSGAAIAAGTYTVQFLPDSMGLAERPFMSESTSECTQ